MGKRYETSVAQDEEDDEEDDDGREAEPEVHRWIKQVQHYLDGPRGEGRIARVDGLERPSCVDVQSAGLPGRIRPLRRRGGNGSHLCVVDWPDGPHQRAG